MLWNPRLLLCGPFYSYLFFIFYSTTVVLVSNFFNDAMYHHKFCYFIVHQDLFNVQGKFTVYNRLLSNRLFSCIFVIRLQFSLHSTVKNGNSVTTSANMF